MSEQFHSDKNEALHHNESFHNPTERLVTIESKNLNTDKTKKTIEQIRDSVEKQAISKESYTEAQQSESQSHTMHYITKKIKAERYQHTMDRVRRHLSPNQQIVSKFIHKPTIETASEIGAKTIARPSGILGGSIIALAGGLFINIVARKVGFIIPNSLFIVLFAIGFIIGIVFELSYRRLKKTDNHSIN